MSIDENEQAKVERLLMAVPLAEPSPGLDTRIIGVLRSRSRWKRVLIPVSSFAAGIVVTVAVMLLLKLARSAPTGTAMSAPAQLAGQPPEKIAAALPVQTEAPRTTLTFIAQTRESVDEFNGVINGTPVHLERRRNQVVLWPNDGGQHALADVVFPETMTVAQAAQY